MIDCKIRNLQKEDEPFIYSTWLKHYREESDFGKSMPNTVFFKGHHNVINNLLLTSDTIIAHDPEDEQVIWGYLVFEKGIIHWVYVKGRFWRNEIAKTMINSASIDLQTVNYSHKTYLASKLLEKYTQAVYNPYLAMGVL